MHFDPFLEYSFQPDFEISDDMNMITSFHRLTYARSSLSVESPRWFPFGNLVKVTVFRIGVEDECLFDGVCQVRIMSPL